jgi:antitoxin component YwqK of YwqJK toxin-antitoxin module
MMQKLPVALALAAAALFSACKSNTKENLLYYNDGKILRRYTTVGDKIEGPVTEYYPDGKVKIERMFQNGLQVGRAVVYFNDGKIK